MKVITLFSGYDAQLLALQRMCIDIDLLAWSDIDKYAIKAHNALFPQFANLNIGDITCPGWLPDAQPIDLLTYSFPCQDISRLGNQAGFSKQTNTRSALLWCVQKYIARYTPHVCIMENVSNITSDRHAKNLRTWIEWLSNQGYFVGIFKVAGIDVGVPQIRRRCFIIASRTPLLTMPKGKCAIKPLFNYLEDDTEDMVLTERVMHTLLRKQAQYPTITLNIMNKQTGIARAITTKYCCTPSDNYVVCDDGRVRRLSPRESLRLMGLTRAEVDKIDHVTSNRRMYQLAGNSIIIDVLRYVYLIAGIGGDIR